MPYTESPRAASRGVYFSAMHRSEAEELEQCASCGAEVAPEDRTFPISDEEVLCFACAVRRGGAFDDPHDRWSAPPDISDLVRTRP